MRSEEIRRIALIGMPGSGKSTLAALLATRLNHPLLDTDRVFEHTGGTPIRALFAAGQESVFRAWESQWLQQLATLPACVIATGGGMPCQPGAMAQLRAHTLTLWLRVSPTLLWERLSGLNHPIAQGRTYAEFLALAASREPFYAQAHGQLNAERPPEVLLEEVCLRLEALNSCG